MFDVLCLVATIVWIELSTECCTYSGYANTKPLGPQSRNYSRRPLVHINWSNLIAKNSKEQTLFSHDPTGRESAVLSRMLYRHTKLPCPNQITEYVQLSDCMQNSRLYKFKSFWYGFDFELFLWIFLSFLFRLLILK